MSHRCNQYHILQGKSKQEFLLHHLFRHVIPRIRLDGQEIQNKGTHRNNFKFDKEPAKNAEKAIQTIRTQLAKLGDTPYIARDVCIESKPYFIPISILNEWRRTTII